MRALHLAPIAWLCLLTACTGFAPAGAISTQDLPPAATRPCGRPGDFLAPGPLTQGQTEILVGRIGDELTRCGDEKAALAAWAAGVLADLERK